MPRLYPLQMDTRKKVNIRLTLSPLFFYCVDVILLTLEDTPKWQSSECSLDNVMNVCFSFQLN